MTKHIVKGNNKIVNELCTHAGSKITINNNFNAFYYGD